MDKSAIICMRGVVISGLTNNEHNDIKSKYVCNYKKKMGNITISKQLYGYEVINNITIYNQRVINICVNNKFDIIDKRHKPSAINYNCNIKLNSNQQVVYDHLMTNIFTSPNNKCCVLIMATGTGKTYTAGKLISDLSVPTLIIVPKISIMTEWIRMFQSYNGEQIGQYYSGGKMDGNIVIMTIDSALNDEFIFDGVIIKWDTYFSKFGMVVFDEIHNYPTNKYKDIFWRTNFMYKLGLTATPNERIDNMDTYYKWHLNTVVFANKLEGFAESAVNWSGDIIAVNYYGPIEYTLRMTNDKGWISTCKMVKQFSEDIYRNRLIQSYIDDMLLRYRNVYVFCEHRDYIINISSKYPDSGVMMGGITDEEYQLAKDKPVIFITYGYGKEGISIPKMNAIIFAHPRKSKMTQIIGRILRQGGDEHIRREIVDIIDSKTPLKSQFKERQNVYKEKGFDIIQKNVKYTDI